MNKKYPFTDKYIREQLEKANPNLYVKKSIINRKKLISMFFGTIFLLLVIGIWNYLTEKHLKNNGIVAKAIISSVEMEYRRINDIELGRIITYSIEYKFIYNSDTVYAQDIIRKEELYKYFDKIPRVNDSIDIVFDTKKLNTVE